MICPMCREQQHGLCKSVDAGVKKWGDGTIKPGMGLSPESAALQRAALCTCQHRMPLVSIIDDDDRNL